MAACKFLPGDLVKVVSLNSGTGYFKIGDERIVTKVVPYSGNWQVYLRVDKPGTTDGGYWAYEYDLTHAAMTVEKLQAKKAELEAELTSVSEKIEFAKATSGGAFDPMQYKIFKALQVMEVTKDKMEQAKQLASILNS